MSFDINFYEEKMKKSLNSTQSEYSTIRAGRANPSILDKVTVDYYGSATQISQVAEIKVPEARMIVITPWDNKLLKDIEKAILTSDIGINPQNDGRAIRLAFPQLTEERRKELTKQVAKLGEEGKVALRNIRRDANDKIKELKKKSEITEDDQKQYEKKVQDLLDKYIKLIDDATAVKNKEIMSI